MIKNLFLALLLTVNPQLSNLSNVAVNHSLVDGQVCNGTAYIDLSGEHTFYCELNGVIRWAVAYDAATKQLVVENTVTNRSWKFPVPYGSTERDASSNKYNAVSFALTPGKASNGWLPIAFIGVE